jgi:hypothetical protein
MIPAVGVLTVVRPGGTVSAIELVTSSEFRISNLDPLGADCNYKFIG